MENSTARRPGALRRTRNIDGLARDVATAVVDLIRKGETSGTWKPGWIAPENLPRSFVYGTRYRGINSLYLTLQAMARGHTDLRFLTYGALKRMLDDSGKPARMREGAAFYRIFCPREQKAMPLPRSIDPRMIRGRVIEDREGRLWEGAEYLAPSANAPEVMDTRHLGRVRYIYCPDGSVWYKRNTLYWTGMKVLNIEDTTARRSAPIAAVTGESFLANDFFEKFVRAAGADIREQGTEAYFAPGDDYIAMPERRLFENAGAYYTTLMHEFYHWTGHTSRENRRAMQAGYGTDAYAREEQRAEMFSAIVAVLFGLDKDLRNTSRYLQSWNRPMDLTLTPEERARYRDWDKLLKDDYKSIFVAAIAVQQVVNAVCDVADGAQPALGWLKKRDFTGVPAPFHEAVEQAYLRPYPATDPDAPAKPVPQEEPGQEMAASAVQKSRKSPAETAPGTGKKPGRTRDDNGEESAKNPLQQEEGSPEDQRSEKQKKKEKDRQKSNSENRKKSGVKKKQDDWQENQLFCQNKNQQKDKQNSLQSNWQDGWQAGCDKCCPESLQQEERGTGTGGHPDERPVPGEEAPCC